MKLRAALVMVVIAVTLTVFTSSQTFAATTVPTTAKALPAVDLSATPAGWVPVTFGKAQLSVPATWWVLYDSPLCPTGSPTGEVFVNPPPGVFACPLEIAPGPSTTVSFGPQGLHSAPSSVTQRSSTTSSCTPTLRDRRAVTWFHR